MRTQRSLLLLQLAIAVAVAGCGRTEPDETAVHYQFSLEAFGRDSTAERRREYGCFLYGLFEVAAPVSPDSTVTFQVRVERYLLEFRGTHIEQTRADTIITDAELAYTGLGQNNPSFMLTAGHYSESVGPGELASSPPSEYSGAWTCGSDVPLAQDSTLLAYGYDGDFLAPGVWRVSAILPFE